MVECFVLYKFESDDTNTKIKKVQYNLKACNILFFALCDFTI